MMIQVKADFRPMTRKLDDLAKKQLPFATAVALTRTAKAAADSTRRELPSIFDKPTPFTMNSIAIQPARKDKLEASMFVKDRQASYLALQETGGQARPKKVALVIPQAAQRNRYGNLAKGALRRLAARKDVFVGAPTGGTGGFYRRLPDGGLKLLVGFSTRASYKPRFGFKARVLKDAIAAWPAAFSASFAQAMRTARK